ncbi:MAG TPA: NUDIX domain-containing protein [Candidatus Eisenbergiella merdipullorum]|uniref:NUDIX domain-containing protein n=1 Tax=Candidatus Eisenbergiella merdipullorum TaxID=2838553 RepID=A0A9D2I2I8_9FIRM|nr:NUDIX domain-containing protein [Candidatus Eisenbergiella merdipullorum]
MELFDIRTSRGELTGRVKERSAVHRDGDWHGTAHIWLVRQERGRLQVLLQKRSRNKETFPGCYDTSCAGHLSAGDSFEEGALRELSEELGIQASSSDLLFVGLYSYEVKENFGGGDIIDREVAAVYLYQKTVDIASLRLQKEEVDSVCWMDFEKLKAHSEAGDPAFCVFAWEIDALEDGFRKAGFAEDTKHEVTKKRYE